MAQDLIAEWEKLSDQFKIDILISPAASALYKTGKRFIRIALHGSLTNPVTAHVMGRDQDQVDGYVTDLSASQNCENWPVPADVTEMCDALEAHKATLRRIGWLDQQGRVWTRIPSGREYNGGSYTPLLIDVRGD